MTAVGARYARIAGELREQIRLGVLKAGDRLPTEGEIQTLYSVSRNTARNAIGLLVSEGLVETRRGNAGGPVVRGRSSLTYFASRAENLGRPGESDAFYGEALAQGLAPSQTLTVLTLALPVEIAGLLHLDAGAEAVLRRCVRRVNDRPNSIQDSWYPLPLAQRVPELLHTDNIREGTTRLLDRRGVEQVAFLDQNVARMPSMEEKRMLELGPGTPVFEHRRTGYAPDRSPVRVSVNIFAGTVVAYTLGDESALPGDL